MKQSQLWLPTLREAPADADAVSHQLLLRAGIVRQLAAGIYTYLPLGRRVLRKLENIVREGMDQAGAQELLMPAMQPAELWRESGRYDKYGPELFRLKDRQGREFALGPTHEEVITALLRDELHSYRQMPVTLYQIQTKFRDEKRPRYGLLRGREFLMKDAYSFDADWEGLERSYRRMYDAYSRIFSRIGLEFRAVEADPGTIGGDGGTHEFMALADIGEDTIAVCDQCDYAANLEKAEFRKVTGTETEEQHQLRTAEPTKLHTPAIRKIDSLVHALGCEASHIIKTIIYLADGAPLAVLVRGDHEVNEIKLQHSLSIAGLELADAETVERITGAAVGFAGPMGLAIPLAVDDAVTNMPIGIAGANETDYHWRGLRPGIDFKLAIRGDFRNAVRGDGCPRCQTGQLVFRRGIEVGQVFKLGTKYSEKLNARFIDAAGKEQPLIMGCYGIGISRLLSAVVEQHHDAAGIRWPHAIAPYQVHIVPVSMKDQHQAEAAELLYEKLSAGGLEVLLDDREERPGVKFKDSDLIGIPLRIVVGKAAADGKVELKWRDTGEVKVVSLEEACSAAAGLKQEQDSCL
ncbi:proline--tRNA ligase [Paenibacillus radicis (ex Gao et al. 2016)]|uniref:Proline--tRNA ligase n=1 Tax=Paenibacillus radicis (ex Gao et al. 2016) TaxID=1737354 RepID=A0A917MBG8_9BACL|nr:proline--tRNA ligase [Paenibacillus radicis (ex Gao et al. 2016)]GGG89723.1 proline--tRNA ligase [Paenibacillus radicis (ex Gao et al. 2016)]